jgi:hypothetical protein
MAVRNGRRPRAQALQGTIDLRHVLGGNLNQQSWLVPSRHGWGVRIPSDLIRDANREHALNRLICTMNHAVSKLAAVALRHGLLY